MMKQCLNRFKEAILISDPIAKIFCSGPLNYFNIRLIKYQVILPQASNFATVQNAELLSARSLFLSPLLWRWYSSGYWSFILISNQSNQKQTSTVGQVEKSNLLLITRDRIGQNIIDQYTNLKYREVINYSISVIYYWNKK